MERVDVINELFSFITQDIKSGFTIQFSCLAIIAVACFIDMWTGIDAARANKERIRSRPLRKTGVKIVDYFRLLVFFMLIDLLGLCFPWYNLPYGTVLGTVGVVIVEGLSVIENLKKKKSHAAEVADIVTKIVECLTKEDAEKIIRLIKDDKNNSYNKQRQRYVERNRSIMPDEDPGYVTTVDDSY